MNYQLTDEEIKFRSEFQEYLKLVPSEILGPMIVENPGERWRIFMIKKSGIKLPRRVEEVVKEYENKQKKHDDYLTQLKTLIENEKDNLVIDINLYIKFKNWIIENGFDIEHHSFFDFKNAINSILKNRSSFKDPIDYELMKISILIV